MAVVDPQDGIMDGREGGGQHVAGGWGWGDFNGRKRKGGSPQGDFRESVYLSKKE